MRATSSYCEALWIIYSFWPPDNIGQPVSYRLNTKISQARFGFWCRRTDKVFGRCEWTQGLHVCKGGPWLGSGECWDSPCEALKWVEAADLPRPFSLPGVAGHSVAATVALRNCGCFVSCAASFSSSSSSSLLACPWLVESSQRSVPCLGIRLFTISDSWSESKLCSLWSGDQTHHKVTDIYSMYNPLGYSLPL